MIDGTNKQFPLRDKRFPSLENKLKNYSRLSASS